MKKDFVIGYTLACHWWRRSDLEPMPVDIERVAEVLRQAGIEVYEVSYAGWLACEPRPLDIREALTGELLTPRPANYYDEYPEQEPGRILRILADKGVPVAI